MHASECVHRGRRVHCGAAWICGLAAVLLPATAAAVFIVSEPWVRPAAGGAGTEAYMLLTSTDGATLVGARSDAASAVAIHAAGKRVAGIGRLPLPPGKVVRLGPDGPRLGLSGLVRPLKPGDRVALTLTIESADGARQEIPVNAGVHRRSPIDNEKRAHPH